MLAYKKPGHIREVDFRHYFHHYSGLVWRWKLWLLFSIPVAIILSSILLNKALNAYPSLPATVYMGAEPIAGMISVYGVKDNREEEAVPSESSDSSALIASIRSREFLQAVAKDLSLRLTVARFNRKLIFDSILIDSLAPSGRYRLVIDKKNTNTYKLIRKDSVISLAALFHAECVARGDIREAGAIQLPGIRLCFTQYFVQHPHNVSFSIKNLRNTVECLRDSLSVRTSTEKRGSLSPSFSITVKGSDYPLIAATANLIADKFVEKNIQLRRVHSMDTREIFEKQVNVAQNELYESEESLKAYRSRNPTIGMSKNTDQLLLDSFQASRFLDSIIASLNGALDLQKRLSNASRNDAVDKCSEIINFLNTHCDNAAPFYLNELSGLVEEKRKLDEHFDENNPLVLKNHADIDRLIQKVAIELQNFIEAQKKSQAHQREVYKAILQRIQQLPSEELKLAEHTRLQQVNADIYSKVLDKYFSQHVSDLIDLPDYYVMDPAAIPMSPPPTIQGKLITQCILLAFLLIFGPMLLSDLTSKTVETKYELKRAFDFTVMESIPRVPLKKNGNTKTTLLLGAGGDVGQQISKKKLLQREYAIELLRILRTKMLLKFLSGSPEKTVVVTSLEANVGKSTISANIAYSLAQQNLKVVIVDGDMRNGTLHLLFNIENKPGLSEYLSGSSRVNVASIVKATNIQNLTIIPAGRYREDAVEMLSSDNFGYLIKTLSAENDIVIFDSPPFGIVADAVSVAKCFSHYLIVAKAGQTNIVDLNEKIAENPQLSSKLMGAVLNFASIDKKILYYKHSKYYLKAKERAIS